MEADGTTSKRQTLTQGQHRIALELAEARRLLAIARRAALVDTDELDVVARLALLLLTAEAKR